MVYADLASSIESFADAAAQFFANLSAVHWTPFALALACLAAMQLARAWAWRNVLRAAYPGVRISFLRLSAAYLAGAGINAMIPARAGDVTKVFLVKRQIPGSSYPAVTSSFLVQTVFDTSVGLLVLLYAVTRGLLPQPPSLPDLPAFEISFWAAHPQAFAIVTVAVLAAIALPSRCSPTGCAASGSGSARASSSSPSRAATCARWPPGRGSAGSSVSPPSGSSSRRSGSAARSATCCW